MFTNFNNFIFNLNLFITCNTHYIEEININANKRLQENISKMKIYE